MNLLATVIALAYPRRCPFCDRVLGNVLRCEKCAQNLQKLKMSRYRLASETHYLGDLDGAASLFHYRGEVRQAILRAKKSGRRWYARELGCLLGEALFNCTIQQKNGILKLTGGESLRAEYDAIVPVPPTDRRRGYNIPQLLAAPLAEASGLPVYADCLYRAKATRRQAGLSRAERLENAAGAFRCRSGGPDPEGKRILLVDDVLTTGATAAACAQALLAAGAESVYAVTLACADEPEFLKKP